MTALRQWLLGVACTALVLAAAEGLAPKGSVKRCAVWREGWPWCWRRRGRCSRWTAG